MSEPAQTVLVIEDEPQMQRFLRASLGVNGYHVLEALTARRDVDQLALHAGLCAAGGFGLLLHLGQAHLALGDEGGLHLRALAPLEGAGFGVAFVLLMQFFFHSGPRSEDDRAGQESK